jgi:endonuclease/exonuclease/phosphatase family metal-dependent hydrolase
MRTMRAMRGLLGVFGVLLSGLASAGELRVSTFNVQWYGLGSHKEGRAQDEHRDKALRKFVSQELSASDVIAFEEIVDVARLKREILGEAYKCVSYSNDDPKHQHVVLCYRSALTLSPEEGEESYTLDSVALGRHRPAVLGLLKDGSGQPLAHLMAVHLKALPDFSARRAQQARLMARRLARFQDGVPVVVLGDFNTHQTEESDDEQMLSEIFGAGKLGLRWVEHRFKRTYRSSRYAGRFDHVWASPELKSSGVRVSGPCNSRDKELIERYNQQISDHCPFSVTLSW